MKIFKHAFVIFFFIVFLLPTAHARESNVPKAACMSCHFIEVPKGSHIPVEQKTYSLFLAPSNELKNMSDLIAKLKSVFIDFGESIGDHNAAIWLASDNNIGIDIQRSKHYSDIFDLDYNKGPYVVVTKSHPDNDGVHHAVVISLRYVSPKRAIRILNFLEQDIRKERELRKRRLKYEEISQKLLSIAEENGAEIKSFMKKIIIKWVEE